MEALTLGMGQNKIKELLKVRNISIYRLAKDTGLTYQAVHALVNAEEIPDGTAYRTLKKIADFLEVKIDDLEGDD